MKAPSYFLTIFGILLFVFAGCGTDRGLYLPEGDSEAGKLALREMKCYSCHQIADQDFPAPVAQPPVPVTLDKELAKLSREMLAESIISPSHRITKDLEGVQVDSLSRMGDFSEAMTVRQLIDIVAYIKALEAQSAERMAQSDNAMINEQ